MGKRSGEYLKANLGTRETPQSEAIPGSTQVANSAGGFAWAMDDWKRLDRFLILGAEGGTYYIGERTLTKENAAAVARCVQADGTRAVRQIVEVSEAGRAPKNDPALFALAMCFGLGDAQTKAAARVALPNVARIGTHLFHFAAYVEQFRGWGRSLRGAVSGWYDQKTVDALALQAVKYQQRDGWSHRDLLRLSHPVSSDPARQALYRWMVGADVGDRTILRKEQKGKFERTDAYAAIPGELPGVVQALIEAQEADEKTLVRLIQDRGLPMECVPTDKRTPEVYRALIPQAGLTWLLRNLGNLSKHKVLVKGGWDEIKMVTARITDAAAFKKGRVHPIAVLSALETYRRGAGVRGSGEWKPVPDVVDALDSAFYFAFGLVEPAGKRTVIGLDVSSSMDSGEIAGVPGLTPRVGSAAMCMVTYKTEPMTTVVAFTSARGGYGGRPGLTEVDFSRKSRLDDVCREMANLPMGGTDCALPMLWALEQKVQADTFVIYTDSETWAGKIHPSQALRKYREQTGIPARFVVVGMTSNGFTIADPSDAGMLDVVGFDSAAPGVIADFSAGRI